MKLNGHYITPRVARLINGPEITSYREATPEDFACLGHALAGANFGELTAQMHGNSAQRSKALRDSVCAALHSIRNGQSPSEFNERFREFVIDQIARRGGEKGRRAQVVKIDSEDYFSEVLSRAPGPKNDAERSLASLRDVLNEELPVSSRELDRAIKQLVSNIKTGTPEELLEQTERIKTLGTMALTGLLYRNMAVRLRCGDSSAVKDAITLAGLSPKGRTGPLIAQQFVNGRDDGEGGEEVRPMSMEDRIRKAEQLEAEERNEYSHALPSGPEGVSDGGSED